MPAGETAAGAALPRFEFATVPRIVFGAGASAELPALAAGFGRRALLVTGARGERHAALVAALRGALDALAVFSIAGEPTVELADRGAAFAREHRCELVIALGGGSALDAGKAIAGLATNPGHALDYLEVVGRGQPLAQPALPILAVPTTAGTGAEVTRNAVLAVPAARVKASLRSPHLYPRVALVDPALALGLPADVTAATGLDALTQLIEPFLSCRANAHTDTLCRASIPRVARALPAAVRTPDDLAARSELALGALHSGLALANAGLGVVHGFAAVLGGRYAAPHGAVCAALLPHVLRANLAALRARAPASPALAKFGELAALLTGDAAAPAERAVEFCASLARDLHIPPLTHWGVRADHVAELIPPTAAASSTKANPLPLTADELADILSAALH